MSAEHFDIAIVGAGVSGIYSAWRLKQKYPMKRIVVFEGGDYVGGRLLSVKPPGISNMMAELGGMRILENEQPLISSLINEINEKLAIAEKIMLFDFPVDQPQNIAYLRGEYLRLQDFKSDADKVPYNLSFLEKGSSPGGIIVGAIEKIIPGITNPHLNEKERRIMAREASFNGKPLYEQGFWNVIFLVISSEAYLFGKDAGGYSSTLLNWNAADAIPWFLSDFGIKPQYKGFKNGYQQVPKSMATFFTVLGGEIRLNTKLSGFEYCKEKKKFHLSVKGEIIYADSLILAMPRRSLDLLTDKSPLLKNIQPLINSVTPRSLFKLYTTYGNPWWQSAFYTDAAGKVFPLNTGRSVTDLPIRQTYYWPKNDGSAVEAGNSMLLASYDDGSNIGYWDGLRLQRSSGWKNDSDRLVIQDPFLGEYTLNDEDDLEWKKYMAPREMVAEVTRQLQLMHDLSFTPLVKNASFKDWGEDPFGGGWNSWNIGVKSWVVKEEILKPVYNVPLYICGEAYSDAQGWVEGALQTAENMLPKVISHIEKENK